MLLGNYKDFGTDYQRSPRGIHLQIRDGNNTTGFPDKHHAEQHRNPYGFSILLGCDFRSNIRKAKSAGGIYRFKGALIELGKVGNAFTAELSNEQLAFLENGQTIAYISNQSLVITNAEIRYKLSLGAEGRGWFDFIPRASGNLSVVWRSTSS